MNKNVKILFTASVLLNVILLGLSGGMLAHRSHMKSWDSVKEQLSPETRNLMARQFQEARREIKPLGEEARDARLDVMQVLSQKELNEGGFDRAVKRLQNAQEKIMQKKVEATKALVKELSVEDRKLLAEHIAQSLGMPPYRGGHKKPREKHDYPKQPERSE